MQGEDMAEKDLDRRSILLWAAGIPAAIAFAARRAFASECAATQQDFLGPMYVPGAPRRSVLAPPNEPGERVRIRGTVFGPDCKTPLSKALVDVWHADAKGNYHGANESYRLRGQILTNERGEYEFDSVKPGNYGDLSGMRPAHFHMTISSPGHEPLTTQLYFKGDPYLGHDMCGPDCHSDDPHRIIELARQPKGLLGTFDVVLKAART
jgi:catechol 1,2-dioxygenase